MTVPQAGGEPLGVASLIREIGRLYRARATGMLQVEHGPGLSRGYFRDGYPAGANVYARFKPLGQFLMEIGWIDIEALDRSLGEVARTGRQQGRILVDLGYLTPERLAVALRRQHLTNFMELLRISEGRFRFEPADALPDWTGDVGLSPHEVVLHVLRGPGEGARIAELLAPLDGSPLLLSAAWSEDRWRFDLDPADMAALDRLDAPVALSELPGRTGLPEERARLLAAALAVFGLWVPEDRYPPVGGGSGTPDRRKKLLRQAFRNIPGAEVMQRAAAAREPPQAPATQPPSPPVPEGLAHVPPELQALAADIELRHGRLGEQDLFARLGLPRDARPELVKETYLKLVKRFHPDRVARAEFPEALRRKVNQLFTAMHEAYETLTDPRRRAEYETLQRVHREKVEGRGPLDAAQIETRLRKGEVLVRRKEYLAALTELAPAHAADPKNGRLAAAYAWARYHVGPRDEVRDDVRKILSGATRASQGADLAWYYLGVLARIEGDLDGAERCFKAALDRNENLADASTELRVLRLRRHREGGASGLIKKVLGRG